MSVPVLYRVLASVLPIQPVRHDRGSAYPEYRLLESSLEFQVYHDSPGGVIGLFVEIDMVGLLSRYNAIKYSVSDDSAINKAKQHFDPYLHTEQYRKIHADDAHLSDLIRFMDVKPAGRYLDLGTGNGYVAFALARLYPSLQVDGLDIAEMSILKNEQIVQEQAISRISFKSFDGGTFPYRDNVFDGIFCRYSFHHYPRPKESIREIRRVLVPGGTLLLSDPLVENEDPSDFINSYAALKPDGHIRYYRREAIDTLFLSGGFRLTGEFESSIRFPRSFNARYKTLIEATNPSILKIYDFRIEGDQVLLTLRIMNKKYLKQ